MESSRSISPWWVLTAVGVGTYMSALDSSVVNTVLPVVRADLHTSVAGIEWVVTVYLLVVSGLMLGVGRAGDLYGSKRIYVTGFGLFVVGSALCGLSTSVSMLVTLRGLQAVGAAMLFANSPAILTKAFPAEKRGRALGAQATFTYLGLTTGPSLGGWLAHALGWRWVFYINVPVGIVGIALAVRMIGDDRPRRREEPFDKIGAVLFTVGLVALLVALNQGHAWGWASPPLLGCFALAVIVLAAFVGRERSTPFPMLDLELFRSPVFSAATTAALFNYICIYGVVFVIPFLLVQGRGLNTEQAGIILTAQPIVMAIVAPIAGALSDRIGSRVFATLGLMILACGLVLLGSVTRSGSLAAIAASLGVVGLGVGLFVSPNNSALMGAAPFHRQGIAAAVLATARNVGMVLGVGFAGAIFTTVLAHGHGTNAALVEGVRASLYAGATVAIAGAVIAFRFE